MQTLDRPTKYEAACDSLIQLADLSKKFRSFRPSSIEEQLELTEDVSHAYMSLQALKTEALQRIRLASIRLLQLRNALDRS